MMTEDQLVRLVEVRGDMMSVLLESPPRAYRAHAVVLGVKGERLLDLESLAPQGPAGVRAALHDVMDEVRAYATVVGGPARVDGEWARAVLSIAAGRRECFLARVGGQFERVREEDLLFPFA